MGVKIISRNYTNQFHSQSENVDWLLGNVGDWQKLELFVEAKVEFLASQQETLSIDLINNTIKLNNGKKWSEYGFDIGDEITFYYTHEYDDDGTLTEENNTVTLNIQNLYDDTLEYSGSLNIEFETIPTDRGTEKIFNVMVKSEKEIEGVSIVYGHTTNQNSESNNLSSLIDGTLTKFNYAGLNNLTPGQIAEMTREGLQSGMAIEKVTVQKMEASDLLGELTVEHPVSLRLETFTDFQFPSDIFIQPSQTKGIPLLPVNSNSDFNETVLSEFQYQTLQSDPEFGEYSDFDNDEIFYKNNSYPNGVFVVHVKGNVKIDDTNSVDEGSWLGWSLFTTYDNGTTNEYSSHQTPIAVYSIHQFNGSVINLESTFVVGAIQDFQFSLGLTFNHNASDHVKFVEATIMDLEVDVINANSGSGDGPLSNLFKINIEYMIGSIFDLNTTPEQLQIPEYLENDGSLTDNFKLHFYPEWNNPNTVIQNIMDETQRLGNTGWYNENFNQLENDFVIDEVVYKTLNGQVLSRLDHTQPTILEAKISGISNLSAESRFTLGFSWLPIDNADYHDKLTPLHQNLKVNTCRKYAEGSFGLGENTGDTVFLGNSVYNSRMDIKAYENVIFQMVDFDTLRVRAILQPTSEFGNEFENKSTSDRNYLIWVSVADHDSQINFSNRVSLILDHNNFEKVVVESGEIEGMTNVFLEHPELKNAIGVERYKGHIEDDILSRVNFSINPTEQKIQGVIFGYEVENLDTGLTYELERYSVGTNQIPLVNGEQDIQIEQTRGFLLNPGNNKNLVEIKRNPLNDDEGKIAYTAFFGTKIRWEDWIERQDAPDEFYNTSLPNNGKHNNWLDYLRNGNYNINFFVKVDTDESGTIKRYKNTFDLDFNGYDENLNILTTHKYFRHSDNTEITVGTDPETGNPLGVILENEPTRIEITFENLVENFDLNQIYGVISLEEHNGPGRFVYRQISSVWDVENNNPLKPIEGENNLKIELVEPNIVKLICIVDNNYITDRPKFKITGRIGCFPQNDSTYYYHEDFGAGIGSGLLDQQLEMINVNITRFDLLEDNDIFIDVKIDTRMVTELESNLICTIGFDYFNDNKKIESEVVIPPMYSSLEISQNDVFVVAFRSDTINGLDPARHVEKVIAHIDITSPLIKRVTSNVYVYQNLHPSHAYLLNSSIGQNLLSYQLLPLSYVIQELNNYLVRIYSSKTGFSTPLFEQDFVTATIANGILSRNTSSTDIIDEGNIMLSLVDENGNEGHLSSIINDGVLMNVNLEPYTECFLNNIDTRFEGSQENWLLKVVGYNPYDWNNVTFDVHLTDGTVIYSGISFSNDPQLFWSAISDSSTAGIYLDKSIYPTLPSDLIVRFNVTTPAPYTSGWSNPQPLNYTQNLPAPDIRAVGFNFEDVFVLLGSHFNTYPYRLSGLEYSIYTNADNYSVPTEFLKPKYNEKDPTTCYNHIPIELDGFMMKIKVGFFSGNSIDSPLSTPYQFRQNHKPEQLKIIDYYYTSSYNKNIINCTTHSENNPTKWNINPDQLSVRVYTDADNYTNPIVDGNISSTINIRMFSGKFQVLAGVPVETQITKYKVSIVDVDGLEGPLSKEFTITP